MRYSYLHSSFGLPSNPSGIYTKIVVQRLPSKSVCYFDARYTNIKILNYVCRQVILLVWEPSLHYFSNVFHVGVHGGKSLEQSTYH